MDSLFRSRARVLRRSASAAFALGLLLLGCDRVLDFRDDYYAVSAGGSESFGGGGDAANLGASGGTPAVTGGEGGKISEIGGTAAGGTSSGGSGEGGSAGSAIVIAGTGGGGSSPVGEAGTSAGGAPDIPRCAENPLTAEATWVPTASPVDSTYPPSDVTDGQSTRWTTGVAQAGGEWLQIDFGKPVAIRRVNLQQGMTYSNDYPRGYQVVVSDTSKNLKGAVAITGVGMSGVTTTIVLPQVFVGRYLLIEQVSTSLSWWSVEEIEVSCYDS